MAGTDPRNETPGAARGAGGATPPRRYGLADLQVHTSAGDGMMDARTIFDYVEHETELDIIAVTDHDDIGGALAAREIHARGSYCFELMTGIELTTRSGHLLALDVDSPLRPLRPLDETVGEIHGLGGIAVVPHPFSYLTRSIGERALRRLLATGAPELRPDGIELASGSLAARVTERKARHLNRESFRLPETGGSDAHFLPEVGRAATLFLGSTIAELRSALAAGETEGRLLAPVPLSAIGWRTLARQQVRGLSVTPRRILGPPLSRARGRLRSIGMPTGGGAR